MATPGVQYRNISEGRSSFKCTYKKKARTNLRIHCVINFSAPQEQWYLKITISISIIRWMSQVPKAESPFFPLSSITCSSGSWHKAEEHSDIDIFVKMKQTPLSSWEKQIQHFQNSKKAYFLI